MKESRFYNRHIGPNKNEINKMLSTLELNSLDELLNQTVPEGIRLKNPLSIEEDISENEFLNEMQEHAEKNKCFYVMNRAVPIIIILYLLLPLLKDKNSV